MAGADDTHFACGGHQGEEPADRSARGRWLGEIYSESDARVNYRKDVLEFLQLLSTEDQQFIAAIDRMAEAGYGKTTLAVNLALLLARGGHRTLLVDLAPDGARLTGPAVIVARGTVNL